MIRLRGLDDGGDQIAFEHGGAGGALRDGGRSDFQEPFPWLWLLSKGLEIDEVAELLSFSTRWVYELVRRYNEGGPDCLGDQRVNNGSEATILTPEALAALKQRIKSPPDDGGLWTGPKVARWLAKFHGLKRVHDQRGWDALIGIEYSIQKPRPRHPEAAKRRIVRS